MGTVNINKEEQLLRQIAQILGRGLLFAEYSKKYKDLYNQKKNLSKTKFTIPPDRGSIVILNILYTQESLLLLNTLFSTRRREASLNTLFKLLKTKRGYKEFIKIQTDYLKTGFADFRNKIISHKDPDCVGEPVIAFLNPIKDECIDKIIEFYERLDALLNKYFDATDKHFFKTLYKESFDYLYEKLK